MTLTLRKPFLALGLTLALAACSRAAPLTEQEQHTVTELTANLKTRCVGRYLIDLPADMQISGSATLQDVQVSTEKMTQEAFLQGMQQREGELKATKHMKGYQFMYGDREYPLVMSGMEEQRKKGIWYFIHLGSKEEISDSNRVIEAYKWSKGYRLTLLVEASDFTRSIYKDRPSVKNMRVKNDVGSKLVTALDLAHNFQGRADDDIPTGPGVCFDGGFIAKNAEEADEVDARFIFSDRQDVNFVIRTDSILREKTLLQRHEQINDGLAKNEGGETVRQGSVSLPQGLHAEEWLLAARMDSGVHGHFFTLEANALANNAKTPFISLDMSNGDVLPREVNGSDKPARASLTEGEAVALWDAVSRTIRVRPGAMDSMPLPPVVRSTRGVPIVTSGQSCPENGHWIGHCNGKIYKRVFFKGDLMPSMEVMQAKPYRWLPARVNAWLEQRERLPMVKVENEVRWHLDSFFSS
jgi:hypothetical protein